MNKPRERVSTEHSVGRVGDLPPSHHKVVTIGGLEVGIYNVDGVFYALHNMCPHQFGPACVGPVAGQLVCNSSTEWRPTFERPGEFLVCPWHGMEFDIKTGACMTVKSMRIRTFPVRVEGDEILVQIGSRRSTAKTQAQTTEEAV